MTGTQLVLIQPLELKFTFEVMKQSSCAVQLTNITEQYVAFKVKTTQPKKYCVRPNIGIIKPKSTVDFTVTMQAQRAAPPDLQCKDKFLIQSTVVPFGKMEEIMPEMFTKDEGKYIQENKLRVFLMSPPQSPVLQPVNGVPKEDSPDNTSTLKENLPIGVENLPPPHTLIENGEDTKISAGKEEPRLGKIMEVADIVHPKDERSTEGVAESRSVEDMETTEATFSKDFELKATLAVEPRSVEGLERTKVTFSKDTAELKAKLPTELVSLEDVETTQLSFSKDIEELKAKLGALSSKLNEAEHTISKLNQEKETIAREKDTLKQELVLWRRKTGVKRVQVGFPPLFLCMTALVGLAAGFLLRA